MAKKKAVKKKSKAKSKTKAKGKAQSAARFTSSYSGPTGEILHFATTTDVAAPGQAPFAKADHEAWYEIGGGQRERMVDRSTPVAGSTTSVAVTSDWWAAPNFQVTVRSPGYPSYDGGTMPSSGIADCPSQRIKYAPILGDPAKDEVAAVRAINARIAAGEALPAGPVIDGHATVAVTLDRPLAWSERPARMVVDRETGQLKQLVSLNPDGSDPGPGYTQHYRLWEVQPAGGSPAALSGTLPAELLVRPASDCYDLPPAPLPGK